MGQIHTVETGTNGEKVPIKTQTPIISSNCDTTVLYGCPCWTLTKDLENKLKTTQRRMLRMILSSGRRHATTPEPHATTTRRHDDETIHDDVELEPWSEWLKRTTRQVEEQMRALKYEGWVQQCRRLKWRWAQRVAAMSSDRWASAALDWTPQLTSLKARRAQGRPRKRWSDEMTHFLQNIFGEKVCWQTKSRDAAIWRDLEDRYVASLG